MENKFTITNLVKYITLDFILLLLVFIISIVTYYIYHHDNRQPLPPILKQVGQTINLQ